MGYLDGELSEQDERLLFSHLQDNAELRAEMKEMLAIHEPLRNNQPLLPAEYKASVMRQLGLGFVSGAGFSAAGGQLGTILIAAASALLSSLLTFLVLLPTSPVEKAIGNAQQQSIATAPRTGIAAALQQQNQAAASEAMVILSKAVVLPEVAATSAMQLEPLEASGFSKSRAAIADEAAALHGNDRTASQTPESSREKAHVDETPDLWPALLDNAVEVSPVVTALHHAVPLAAPSDSPAIRAGNRVARRLSTSPLLSGSSPGTSLFSDVSLGLRGFRAMSFPDLSVDPLIDPSLNNLAVSLAYHILPQHSIGIEIGQEHFLQRYHSQENGRPIIIEQNYLGFWLGAFHQYDFDESASILGTQPFLRSFVGATRGGPLLRLVVGSSWKILDQSRLYTGIEGSALLFHNGSTWYSTEKLGATLGIEVKL